MGGRVRGLGSDLADLVGDDTEAKVGDLEVVEELDAADLKELLVSCSDFDRFWLIRTGIYFR